VRNAQSWAADHGRCSGLAACFAVGGSASAAGLPAISLAFTADRSAAEVIVWMYRTVRGDRPSPARWSDRPPPSSSRYSAFSRGAVTWAGGTEPIRGAMCSRTFFR